ncbi:MAG: response regulator [Desulfobacula sp.]|nr:response regulator [Desulfobacula sp.]
MNIIDDIFDDLNIKKKDQKKFCQFIETRLPQHPYCLIPDNGDRIASPHSLKIEKKYNQTIYETLKSQTSPFIVKQGRSDTVIAHYIKKLEAILLIGLPKFNAAGIKFVQHMIRVLVDAFFSEQTLREENELSHTRKEQMNRKLRLLEKKNMEILTQSFEQHKKNAKKLESEIKKQTRDLVKSRKNAENANHAKSAFLANMSHEIRTPMNGILGMLQILSETRLSQEQQSYVESTSQSANALLTLINDILDFSKIEAGKLAIEIIDFSIKNMMDAVINTLASKAFEKRLELFYLIEKNIPDNLSGDPARIRQILINLIGNAVKFTSQGKIFVKIKLKKELHKNYILLFEVKDTGIGIPIEKQGSIFDSFSQADTSTTRKFGGTGLGLAISKQLAQLMGGKIGVTSELDKGSIFWFTVKLKQHGFKPSDNEVISTKPNKKKYLKISSGLKILLAEDNIINQKVVSIMLEKLGHSITIAGDGRQTLNLYEQEPFDLILMDIQMPVMDGEEATRKIRSLEKKSKTHIPIIALTANAMKGDKERYLKSGMDGYVAKPLQKTGLLKAIYSVLS